MIRILTNEFYPRTGGIATYSLELARALVNLGSDVIVSCPVAHDHHADWPFTIEGFRSRGTQDPDDLWRIKGVLQRHIKECPGETLFLTEPAPIKSLLLVQGFVDLSQTPLWLTFHGSELAQLAKSPFWRKRLLKLAPKVTRFIVNGSFTRKLLLGNFPDWASRVRVVQPAVSEEWKNAFADSEKEPTRSVRLLTVARLHPRKGQVEVVNAVSSIRPCKEVQLNYTIVGDARRARYRKEIMKAAAACPWPVDLAGELAGEPLRKAFAEADIFVMASQPDPESIESFGMVYLEAAAAGLPVIATDVGGVQDALHDGETAILIPSANPAALQNALEELIGDADKRRRMGQAGKRFAAGFSWEESAKELVP